MANLVIKRGNSEELKNTPLEDGQIAFTTDNGKIHFDYLDNDGVLKRKTCYSGKLTFGNYVYDGTSDVQVTVYNGDFQEE